MIQEPSTDVEKKAEGGSLLQLAAIVEESHDAIVGKTLDGIITSWNGGAKKMFGYSAEEVIGKPMTNLFPEELKDELPKLLDKVKLGEVIADYDSVWLRKDGTRADVEFSISPVHTEKGVIIGASLVGRDITLRKKSEELMRQIELIVENSHDAIIGIIGETREGIITSWNGGAAKMFGYSAEEIIGKPVSFLTPEEFKAEAIAMLNRVVIGEIIADYDTVWIRKDGSRIDIAISISPIKDKTGNIMGASIVERDITMRKKSEELMRQTQLIVDNSYDAIIGESLEGIITSWNSGAVKMFNYSSEEVIGKPASLLLPLERQGEVLIVLNKIKNGEMIADYDTVRLRKDGTMINVAFSASPIQTKDGTVIGASIVERDISIRKKTEESMRQTQLIVDNLQDAIIGETLEGIITSWNSGAAKMFGYLAKDVIGKSVSILIPPDLQEEPPLLMKKIKAGEVVTDYDSVRVRKDGTTMNVSLSASPIQSMDGKILGASVTERDVTMRKKEELQIKELNEIRSKFITIISHQLRTPLTAVNWNLEMVLGGKFGKLEDVTLRFLQATYKASIEITNRINDLLTAIDIEEGHALYKEEEVAIDSVAAAVLSEAIKRCELKNISCQYIAPENDLPAINGDGEKIRIVINKLVDNAIVYTKESGKIVVKLYPKGDMVRFEVKDSGIGIPETEQHRLFTRFFRASNSSVMQPDSFGLGLFIAKSFVDQHGGKIGFESKEGEGSMFWFEISSKTKH